MTSQLPCEECHKHQIRCIYRPGKTLQGSACLPCFSRNHQCTAGGGQKLEVGEDIMFLHPTGLRGKKPKISEASAAVRAEFIDRLTTSGVLGTWPSYFDREGKSCDCSGVPGTPGAVLVTSLTCSQAN